MVGRTAQLTPKSVWGPRAPARSITHVVAGLEPAQGGPSYSVPRLCEALAAAGEARVRLFSVAKEGIGIQPGVTTYDDRRFRQEWAFVPLLGRLKPSRPLARALGSSIADADVIHSHGLWLAPNLYAAGVALRAGKPHVISPRGMLSEVALGISRHRKRLVWRLGQGGGLRRAALIHVTSEAELEDIRRLGLNNPVAVIPNGVDIPEASAGARDRTVLALGRVHPKKGLAWLVRAWARVEPLRPDWRLRIVGPAEAGHDRELIALAHELGLHSAGVEGPLYGEQRLEAYRSAAVFVLPTLNENFGLVAAEALAAGLPVICTKGAPWSGLEQEQCGWWIDHGEEALAASLLQATALPDGELAMMGDRGRAWMARDFGWGRIAREMAEVYRWVVGGGERPVTVRLA